MLKTIKNFFENHLNAETAANESTQVDRIHLASAALLIELGRIDQSIDQEESQVLLKILQQKFNLEEERLMELYRLAEQEVEEASSLYQFTSLINEAYDRPCRIRLLSDMWEVAYADGKLDRHEDHLIRKIADLLYLSHSDFIRTKLAVKERLEAGK